MFVSPDGAVDLVRITISSRHAAAYGRERSVARRTRKVHAEHTTRTTLSASAEPRRIHVPVGVAALASTVGGRGCSSRLDSGARSGGDGNPSWPADVRHTSVSTLLSLESPGTAVLMYVLIAWLTARRGSGGPGPPGGIVAKGSFTRRRPGPVALEALQRSGEKRLLVECVAWRLSSSDSSVMVPCVTPVQRRCTSAARRTVQAAVNQRRTTPSAGSAGRNPYPGACDARVYRR